MAEILTPKLAPPEAAAATAMTGAPLIEIEDVSLYYGTSRALKNISLKLDEKVVTAFIGPSGCGKSTLLRCLNRMNDLIDNVRIDGAIRIGGHNIYDGNVDVIELRKRVGMVFQKSNPFPKSIYENVAYGLRLHGVKAKSDLDSRIEESLRASALWDEVKDRLNSSALDPIATARIEDLILDLKKEFTIVIVTHNMQQAARISDQTAFFYIGELVEFGATRKIFTNPAQKRTEDYVSGRFG